jgi:DNA-binding response OmpR family regulator
MKVLLIENHEPRNRVLKQGLEERGFAVDVAHDGDEGDEKAQADAYDLIVLNRSLPVGDGLSLLRQWRSAGITADVFVLTPPTGVQDEVRCLEWGADGYLTIPFEPEELFARLRALARRSRRTPRDVIRCHDLEIDTGARVVKRAGRHIDLTPREYALLEFLARRRGTVVSRATIWRDLYDQHDASRSNLIDVYIRYLRRKIDRGFDPELIVTHYGKGYLLRADPPQQACGCAG